jgi:hypothetical protein
MITLIAALVLASTTTGSTTSVPNAQNFAACNAEARDAVKSRSGEGTAASPLMKDRQRAGEARQGEPDRQDPQLAGIDPEGAKDPAYQAAYRTCMRKSGF